MRGRLLGRSFWLGCAGLYAGLFAPLAVGAAIRDRGRSARPAPELFGIWAGILAIAFSVLGIAYWVIAGA